MWRLLPVLIIVFAVWIVWTATEPLFVKQATKEKTKQKTNKRNKRNKRVRFTPVVKMTAAGGCKKDRFNPDLRGTVSRNAQLAASVGSAKKLAEISLLEADDSSSQGGVYSS